MHAIILFIKVLTMNLIELEVVEIHNSQMPTEAYALVLKKKGAELYIPIVIGLSEARGIVLELNKMKSRRPTPHDLFVSLATVCKATLNHIVIYRYEEGVYYANLILSLQNDEQSTPVTIDSRTSDAVTLALKYQVPIFIEQSIFEQNVMDYSYSNEEIEEEDFMNNPKDLEEYDNYIDRKIKEMTNDELQTLLEGSVESEDFELASKIHEEIERRK